MPATTFSGNAILNHILRGVQMAVPASIYVSLHTADPGLTGANEVTVAAWPTYKRQQASQGAAIGTGFNAAAAKATVNAKLMTFGDNDGANPVAVSHFALWDAQTGGNCYFVGKLDDTKNYLPSDEAVVRPFALTIQVD